MAQNITSLLELKARQDELPDEQKPVLSLDDLIYVVHGLGSDRDAVWTLAEFIAFLVANEKFDELKLVKDSSNYIPIKWDSANNEFVIWQRANSGTVAVPKLHVHGTLLVEKDTTINADLAVNKTLHVTQSSTFDGMAEFNDYVISKKGLDSKGKSVFERINAGSSKSYFEVIGDVNINTLLANTTVPVSKGDIVTVLNTSDNSVTITMGTRAGSGGYENKQTTLNSLCAMQFICVLHQVTQSATYNEWAPLGNAAVTWS